MIIPEVAPMLTCTRSGDGFQYELLLRAAEGLPAITKIRIGPYLFKPEYRPRKGLFGTIAGGPETGFLMHKSTPRGWSRFNWEVATDEPDSPTYLVSRGVLHPGEQGIFKFISEFAPGGLRTGLQVTRNKDIRYFGVTGPNYEHFLEGDHH